MSSAARKPYELWAIVALTLLAFGLRVWAIERVPPGWRDDELIETLVISQKMLDGDLRLFYPDASGHEALYHGLNAIFLAAFGANGPGIRLLSAILGTLAVPLTYLVGRKLFGPTVGLAAAAMLAVSFWGLMYSRVGIRHVLTPPLALAAFYWFWRALGRAGEKSAGEKGSRGAGVTRAPVYDPSPLLPSTSAPLQGQTEASGNPAPLPPSTSAPLQGQTDTSGNPAPLLPSTPAPLQEKSGLWKHFALSGLFLGLGFHAYFASRGVPLIIIAFAVYLLVVAAARFRATWRGIALTLAVAVLVIAPLWLTIQAQPEAEARIDELAMPLNEARAGNITPLIEYTWAALTMAHATGDPEWLYNIPERPVFGPIGAIFFWIGLALVAWRALRPLGRTARYWLRGRAMGDPRPEASHADQAAAFLLLWWLAGIAPAFLSVPPASLGHVIVAQPAFYLLAALPLGVLLTLGATKGRASGLAAALLGLLLVGSVALRDLPDYFVEWPARGMVRYLYRADLYDVAAFIHRNPTESHPADFGITGLLAGPWDRVALEMELDDDSGARPRWYDPRRALLLAPDISFAGYPDVDSPYAAAYTPLPEDAELRGDYELMRTARPADPPDALVDRPASPICFANGLCWAGTIYDAAAGVVELEWRVGRPLELPPLPLISNPPPPGVYAGPRLYAFAQLLGPDGAFLAGDDGLWVDPLTLRPGDVFIQRHLVRPPDGAQPAAVAFGLYDPMTGERILTEDGRDSLRLELGGER